MRKREGGGQTGHFRNYPLRPRLTKLPNSRQPTQSAPLPRLTERKTDEPLRIVGQL
jgi:hypothetical protein